MAWIGWAEQLKVGDRVWHQRCKGDDVPATVAHICLMSGTCWVEYSLPTGHRRSLLRLAELFQRNRTVDNQEVDAGEAFNLSDANLEENEEHDPCEAFDPHVTLKEPRWKGTNCLRLREQEQCRQEALEELKQLEQERREAEECQKREFLEEQEGLQQEQRERWSRFLEKQERTLQNTVADIKNDMENLKEQLQANHEDIEVSFLDYEKLFEEREKIDEAREDFEKEQLTRHQVLIQRAEDLSKATAEDILLAPETFGLQEDEEIQLKVFVLHKDHLECFAENTHCSTRIDLEKIDFFKEQEDGISFQLIGSGAIDLKMPPESREKWCDALQPLIRRSKDEAVATDDPPLPAPSPPPSSIRQAYNSLRGATSSTVNAARSVVHTVESSSTASLAAVPFVDVISAGALAVQAAQEASRRIRSNARSREEVPTSF